MGNEGNHVDPDSTSITDEAESEWNQEQLKAFLKQLLSNVVAIAGTYRHTRGEEMHERPYAFSGCVVRNGEDWSVLTAGHAIEKHVRDCKSDGVQIVSRVLADCFGTNAVHFAPIPFDPVSRVDHCLNEPGGLDYALFRIDRNERDLLVSNGIQPFLFRSTPLTESCFDRYFIVGFPEERLDTSVFKDGNANVILQPVCVPVRPIEAQRYPESNGRLVFEIIDKGDLGSIVGLSGGPVFGISHVDDKMHVYLLAIQSAWDKKSIAFACSIEDICHDWTKHTARSQR